MMKSLNEKLARIHADPASFLFANAKDADVAFGIAATVAFIGGTILQSGLYCEQPLKSTWVGDRFNAAFALGLLLGYCPADCLLCGTASSGFLVRNAKSASLKDIADFLMSAEWDN